MYNNLESKIKTDRSPEIGGFRESTELMQHVEASSVISFDFFDTLFTRPLSSPEDVFDLIGLQFGMKDFRVMRRLAQEEAFRRMHSEGRKEITLGDIYACFPESKVSCEDLMKMEYSLELSLAEPNSDLIEWLQYLQAIGKHVVITSDMYFREDFFREVLEKYGLAHVPLFVSADYNATKRDAGDLFDILVQALGVPPDKILHIGDNYLADVQRPREKGIRAFHYRPSQRRKISKTVSLGMSIGLGLLRKHGLDILPGSFAELGFLYGGPATVGFLDWIIEQARRDEVDHILFLARDGYALDRIARTQADSRLPSFSYFLGSRTAFTLAAITSENFKNFIPFLLSGSNGLSPSELLERIGVPSPSSKIMTDIGLGDNVRITTSLYDKLASFLFAYRWEILKICRKNRRALYQYLLHHGVEDASRVALVDVGWSGTTQEAFELAVTPLFDLEVYGYYFCLADTPERKKREQTQRMSAMVTANNTSEEIIKKIYKNRLIAELFFTAPHHSVIGLETMYGGVEPVYDAGRGETHNLIVKAQEVVRGIESFAENLVALERRIGIPLSPVKDVWPLIDLIVGRGCAYQDLLETIANFDAWGSSRNHRLATI